MILYYTCQQKFDNIGILEVRFMDSIIDTLYDCFPYVHHYSTPEREKITEEYAKLSKQVAETFGRDVSDRLAELHEQRLNYQGEEHFATGLRVGVRLMLEVFTSPTE